jgi:hypothetical protein
MPTSSNYTEVSVHCCYGKHTVAEFANFIDIPPNEDKQDHVSESRVLRQSPAVHC